MTKDVTVWGIHAGRHSEAHSLFLEGNVVALGWSQMGNLAQLAPDREAFKARVVAAQVNKKAGAIPGTAGQLFRFVHEMAVGDVVVYPAKDQRRVHIGRVDGPYSYQPQPEPGYSHHRPVKWLRSSGIFPVKA